MQVSKPAHGPARILRRVPVASAPSAVQDEVEGTERIPGVWERIGLGVLRSLAKGSSLNVAERRQDVLEELRSVPTRAYKLSKQGLLLLELIDDVRTGKYRAVPWLSIVVASWALLYAVNPADLIPDVVPGIGGFDDLLVLGFAVRVVQRDLQTYCAFKGYPPEDYF